MGRRNDGKVTTGRDGGDNTMRQVRQQEGGETMMGERGEGDNDNVCLPPHVSTDNDNAPTIPCPQLMMHVHHPTPERRVLFYFIYANVLL